MPALRRSRALLFAALMLAAPTLPAAAAAQGAAGDSLLTVARFLDFEQVASPQISPDGSRIVYTRRWVNQMEDSWESALWIMDADGSHAHFLAKGGNAAWSPDGKRLAYLAEGEPKGAQIFVRWMDRDAPSTQVTRLTNSPADIHWSPDGQSIGFTAVVPHPANWKIDMPAAPKGAKWTEPPRLVESLHFKQDRRGFMEEGYRHLFLVPADGGTERQVTHGDWSVGARFDMLDQGAGWDFTPDGRFIVVDGMQDSTADLNYRNSNLYVVNVADGSTRRLTTTDGVWTNPAVSPDGKRVAFAGYPATRASYQAAELYAINLDGSGMTKLSQGLDRDVENITWSADGRTIYFNVGDHGTSNVYAAAPGGGARQVTKGDHMLGMQSLSRTGVAAGILSAPRQAPDVVRIDLAEGAAPVQLTHVNEDVLGRVKLGDVQKITYKSSGGASVDGWVVLPPDYQPSRKYPLILEIHGGPHGMYGVGFNYMFQTFAANDYVVLYTNPRGSTGYGSAFGNAIERAYPSVDYDDLMAGVDTVIGRGMVDTTRMFVGGCSGGGVLSSWVIGHTTRFAAAAVRCPVIDWMSFVGQTDVPLFTANFFDKPFWEDPEPWLKQSSLMYVGNVTTPTLLMTGELDRRTPMPQTEEYYAALKMRGVPAALLRFNGEYHGTGSKPSNYMRTMLYMMSWYEKWGGKPRTTTDDGN